MTPKSWKALAGSEVLIGEELVIRQQTGYPLKGGLRCNPVAKQVAGSWKVSKIGRERFPRSRDRGPIEAGRRWDFGRAGF